MNDKLHSYFKDVASCMLVLVPSHSDSDSLKTRFIIDVQIAIILHIMIISPWNLQYFNDGNPRY